MKKIIIRGIITIISISAAYILAQAGYYHTFSGLDLLAIGMILLQAFLFYTMCCFFGYLIYKDDGDISLLRATGIILGVVITILFTVRFFIPDSIYPTSPDYNIITSGEIVYYDTGFPYWKLVEISFNYLFIMISGAAGFYHVTKIPIKREGISLRRW